MSEAPKTMLKNFKQSGAGGFWQTIDEQPDEAVIRQSTPLSCVSATGAMLLRHRGFAVSEEKILAKLGEAANMQDLAHVMNEIDVAEGSLKWRGLFVEVRHFTAITQSGFWGAVFREGSPLGHLVMVAGIDKSGLVKIKDPWDATSYKMEKREFLRIWGGELVFRWKF